MMRLSSKTNLMLRTAAPGAVVSGVMAPNMAASNIKQSSALPTELVSSELKAQRQSHQPTRVVCIASGKGGVGKTSITINLAHALAQRDKKLLIVDADLNMANVCISLGLQAHNDIAHVISGEKKLQDIILTGPDDIGIIPVNSGNQLGTPFQDYEYNGIVAAFSQLHIVPDVLLVDLTSGLCENVINFCRAAHDILVVINDEPSSFAGANKLIKVLNEECNVRKFYILVNRASSNKVGRNIYLRFLRTYEQSLNVTPLYFGTIPEDSKLKRAIKNQRSVIAAYPNSHSATAFHNLASQLLRWPLPSGNGGLQFFIEQTVAAEKNL